LRRRGDIRRDFYGRCKPANPEKCGIIERKASVHRRGKRFTAEGAEHAERKQEKTGKEAERTERIEEALLRIVRGFS
jgi:hypothetical protein